MIESVVERKRLIGRYFVTVLQSEGLVSEEQAQRIFKKFILMDEKPAISKNSKNVA